MSTKPYLRGHFHQSAFFMAFGACLMLLIKTEHSRALFACLIYSLSLIALLGTSALYHRVTWEPKARSLMKRLDHSAIYLLIAGTFTPICLLALDEGSGIELLLTIWTVAVLGILQSIFFVGAPKWLSAILYLIAGYLIMPYVSELKGSVNLVLLIGGGIIYTLGALTYALRKPNFKPDFFGYHEVFHLLVVIAAIFHFAMIYQIA